jgi:hypothetical protein
VRFPKVSPPVAVRQWCPPGCSLRDPLAYPGYSPLWFTQGISKGVTQSCLPVCLPRVPREGSPEQCPHGDSSTDVLPRGFPKEGFVKGVPQWGTHIAFGINSCLTTDHLSTAAFTIAQLLTLHPASADVPFGFLCGFPFVFSRQVI